MAEIVYRLLQGDGMQIVEDSAAKTVTLSVPGLGSKLNVGDIVQATQAQAGIIEIATTAEVRAGTDVVRAVTPAGLAAAAQANATDATVGRLLKFGAFGLGDAVSLADGVDLNTVVRSGFYRLGTTHVNWPSSAVAIGQLIVSRGSGTVLQIVSDYAGLRLLFRSGNPPEAGGAGSWQAWRSLWHDANFDPAGKANTSGTYSGLNVGNASTVGNQTDAMLAPPGMIATFAMPTPPSGWLAANGSVVSRTTYANLFAAIGTTYGAGNGSTTFNLPDCRGMFIRGWDAGRGQDAGRIFGTAQGSQNLSHSHVGASSTSLNHTHGGSTSTDPGHSHAHGTEGLYADYGGGSFVGGRNYPNGAISSYRNQNTSPSGSHSHSLTVNPDGAHAHTITVNADGGTEARPVNVAFLACVKF